MENHINAIFTPLGEKVDRVPLEGLGWKYAAAQSAAHCFFFGGGANVDYLLPHCLGAGLLQSRGSGLGLLGGNSLHHVGGQVPVFFVVNVLARVVVVEVDVIIVIVGHVVIACVVPTEITSMDMEDES